MSLRIALAGNPNCGKTTLFNALTGSNQFVGNWPGVTVEKKEGKLKKHNDIIVTDLPGIYSLSPYTLEEVVARNYLINEKPDVILNIVDGTNLERNLYLTTQLTELGIPVVIAVNMMDLVKKNGDKINIKELSKKLGCTIVEISALKGTGIMEAAEEAIKAAENTKTVPAHTFSGPVEHAIAHIEEAELHDLPEEQQRWYAIKIFERDEKVIEQLNISKETLEHIEKDIAAAEKELDDDAESIITNERYVYIGELIKGVYKKKSAGQLTTSDKIDKVVTNRWAALPIFIVIMFLVYSIASMPIPMPWGDSLGTVLTDWANDGVFGDGWYLFGIGRDDYDDAMSEYAQEHLWNNKEFTALVDTAVDRNVTGADGIQGAIEDEDFGGFEEAMDAYAVAVDEDIAESTAVYVTALKAQNIETADFEEAVEAEEEPFAALFDDVFGEDAEDADNIPANEDYGVWIPGLSAMMDNWLTDIGCAEWLHSLVIDGILAGVGAVLGFVPQMLLLFIMLAILESCGYMARVAFIMDRIFRKFGLSGKSFIPMLIGTGCGVPGIMASRTIENDRDRKMTIMTTTFIPCGAKLPIITMISVALFGGSPLIMTSAYFLGVIAIVTSGIMLKKTKMFAGDPAPFVMELPAYHLPTVGNVLRSMWERGWSFIKKAGTIILLASIVIWAGSTFGWTDGVFGFNADLDLPDSILGKIGGAIMWIFAPLGFNNEQATIATIMGLVAKEEVVGVFGVLDFQGLAPLAGYSFLAFNLLCAPCFAAIGAIRREMNSAKWTWFAIGYQCAFAYAVSLIIYQIGSIFTGALAGEYAVAHIIGLIFALAVLGFIGYMLFKPYKESNTLSYSGLKSKSKAKA